jgi:hypothetical protein
MDAGFFARCKAAAEISPEQAREKCNIGKFACMGARL